MSVNIAYVEQSLRMLKLNLLACHVLLRPRLAVPTRPFAGLVPRRRPVAYEITRLLHTNQPDRQVESVETPSRPVDDPLLPFADASPSNSSPPAQFEPAIASRVTRHADLESFEPEIEMTDEYRWLAGDKTTSRPSHSDAPTTLLRRSHSRERVNRAHGGDKGHIKREKKVGQRLEATSVRSEPGRKVDAAAAAPTPETKPKKESIAKAHPDWPAWRVHKEAIKRKLDGAAWSPSKKISPEAMEGVRALNASYPDQFTTPVLAQHFQISPDAVRRILKSKWRASGELEEERMERWERRGERIWKALVEKGVHAPKKWREKGIGAGPRRASQGKVTSWRGEFQSPREMPIARKAEQRVEPKEESWMSSLAGRL